MLIYIPRGIHLIEDILNNISLMFCAGTAEMIKLNVKPLVNIPMHRMVAVTEFSRGNSLFPGLGFRGSTVFIGSTNIEGFIALLTAVTCKHIGGKHLDEVPQMGNIIHIG
jgi:hypothetical protein